MIVVIGKLSKHVSCSVAVAIVFHFQLNASYSFFISKIRRFYVIDSMGWYPQLIHKFQCLKPGVCNLFAIAGDIAFIYMKYGRQRVRFELYLWDMANQCCQLFLQGTKSSPKIYQTHTCNKKFQCLLIVSRGWLTVAVKQCHHRCCTLNFYFLTLAVTDLVTTGKFNLPTPPTTFSFPLWSRPLLCSIIAGNFFALLAEGIRSTSRILFYKPYNLCQSLFVKSSGTLVRSFPTFGCTGWLKDHT